MLSRLGLIVWVILIGVSSACFAQPVAFACPKAGTVEVRGPYIFKYTGPSSDDPYICTLIDPWGRPDHELFNIYRLSGRFDTAEANAAAREGMLELLSGQKTSVRFEYTNANGTVDVQIWTMLRQERYQLNGKTYELIVFDNEHISDSRTNRSLHAHYIRWLNPEMGLWLKAELQIVSGGDTWHHPKPYVDTDITLP